MASSNPEKPAALPQTAPVRAEAGTLARAALVVVLTFALVGALRWAMNVTNANAAQVSHGLTHLQDRFGQTAPHDEETDTKPSASAQKSAPPAKSAPGPSIDAVDAN